MEIAQELRISFASNAIRPSEPRYPGQDYVIKFGPTPPFPPSPPLRSGPSDPAPENPLRKPACLPGLFTFDCSPLQAPPLPVHPRGESALRPFKITALITRISAAGVKLGRQSPPFAAALPQDRRCSEEESSPSPALPVQRSVPDREDRDPCRRRPEDRRYSLGRACGPENGSRLARRASPVVAASFRAP